MSSSSQEQRQRRRIAARTECASTTGRATAPGHLASATAHEQRLSEILAMPEEELFRDQAVQS